MFRRGRRLFTVASILIFLVTAAHTAGGLSGAQGKELEITKAMSDFRADMGMGMNPSMMDIFRCVFLTLSVAWPVWAVQNLVIAKFGDDRLVRIFSYISLAGAAGNTALGYYYQLPPPIISFSIVSIVFLLAIVVPSSEKGE